MAIDSSNRGGNGIALLIVREVCFACQLCEISVLCSQ